MRVAVVIPTRNRPHHATQLLEHLSGQALAPSGVVVVDSSDADRQFDCAPLRGAAFDVRVVRVDRASATFQRNLGTQIALEADPDAVCFLDDDVRPHADYLRRLSDLLARDTVGAVGGVSGTTGWTPARLKPSHVIYNRLFLLGGPADGRLLKSGYNLPVDASAGGVHPAQWLFGCSMWRAEVLRRYAFNEALTGGALCEDVELSVRVAKERMLLVDTDALIDHLSEMDQRPEMILHYERLVRNRAEVIKAMDTGVAGWCAFWWSVVGDAGRLLRHSRCSEDYRKRLRGLARGSLATVCARPPR